MNGESLVCTDIKAGKASRFIKPAWIDAGRITTQAFDLREGNPPEPYVSHFLVSGVGAEIFVNAHKLISKARTCNNGSIAIIDIAEALSEINEKDEKLIKFFDQKLPHCGLVYLTSSQEEILETKATLCLLAQLNVVSVKSLLSNTAERKIA